jgi:drug/metabolite transporter (DMT)-like permease
MVTALFMHYIVKAFHIPFPGYVHSESSAAEGSPGWMLGLLIVPAIFDLMATALCMFGLRDVNVSVYQMLRGSAIVFVAILKHFVLGDKLKKFMWVGVWWNVVSIILVGAVAILTASDDDSASGSNAARGVTLVLCGAFMQSLQYAFEEKVMTAEISAPPLLLIGMEGLWGTLLCVLVVYPIAYVLPGPDHGSYENYENTWYMFTHSSDIQKIFFVYFLSILSYNVLAVLVTYTLNSVWHAILDNFRPITVWCSELFIYYVVTTSSGEEWTSWSYLQLFGLVILLYGTAIYNAPNPGSLLLRGGASSLCMDFSEEYDEMMATMEEMERLHPEAPVVFRHSSFGMGTPSTPNRGAKQAMVSPLVNYGAPPGYGGVDQGYSLQAMRKIGSFA